MVKTFRQMLDTVRLLDTAGIRKEQDERLVRTRRLLLEIKRADPPPEGADARAMAADHAATGGISDTATSRSSSRRVFPSRGRRRKSSGAIRSRSSRVTDI